MQVTAGMVSLKRERDVELDDDDEEEGGEFIYLLLFVRFPAAS